MNESLVRAWSAAYSDEVLDWAQPPTVSNMEVFADVYHSLIHSPVSATLLQLEHSYAAAVESLCRERDAKMADMDTKHSRAMMETVAAASADNESGGGREQDVTNLATHQIDERQLLSSKFESELASLHEVQLREFKQWVMCVHEEYKTNNMIPTTGTFPRSESSFSMSSQPEVASLQESFTITLGAQMKQMHNLRLVAANVLDLCRYTSGEEALPQRLQTSMSLYSNNLCGLVILTDNRIPSVSGVSGELRDLCNRSTEFHFPTVDSQLESAQADLKKLHLWRSEFLQKKLADEAKLGDDANLSSISADLSPGLKPGDVYLTKHSNLCETHVILNMVVDDTVENNSMSSRHPVILGLRNVLKTACLNDITTLTLPLLLGHKMTERMTVAWCMKRAELVFKCVKGFMMEMGGWGGTDVKTVQFLVPANIDTDVFNRLTAMLTSIFRVSNPIRGS